ncbi:MAG: carbon starvation CstA family protein [Nibricoccus sp.]
MPLVSSQKWLRVLGWSAVIAAGTFSLAVLAWSRGEPVNALWVVVVSLCVFAVSYRFHSAWLTAKVLTLDEMRATPAMVHEDGRDFVKTNRWVVFGHHFAAIAGPGPLVGPVLAAQFGFMPGLLWMLIGATLGGAVHDSVILFCSTRRRGKSLGQMISEEINPVAGVIALVSILAILVILIAVLGLVVVNALAESPWGLFTIAATMPIAILMGLAMRGTGHSSRALAWISAAGFVALLLAVYAGKFVHDSAAWAAFFKLKGTTLAWWMIGYGFLASVLPVWLLLAPRDYLSTFMKIGTVGLLAVAIVAIAPALKMAAWTKFVDGTGPVLAGPVFPFCFITIACAAVSGFHSLISSGTTPKMITRESDIRVIGYGAMITEMLVGIMALVAACAMEPGEYFAVNVGPRGQTASVVQKVTALGYPVTETQMTELAASVGEETMVGRTGGAPTFAVGMAKIFARVLQSKGATALWYHFAIMFEALFILTTIDAGTRVGRFLMQDLLGRVWAPLGQTRSTVGNWVASAVFVAAWGWFLYAGVVDPNGGINSLWPIFGVANQLLAVLALALGTTVLIKMQRTRYIWATVLPLIWLLAVTMTAGVMKIFSSDPRVGFLRAADVLKAKITAAPTDPQLAVWRQQITNNYINTAVTVAFLVLVLLVILVSVREWWLLARKRREPVVREEPYVALASLGRN